MRIGCIGASKQLPAVLARVGEEGAEAELGHGRGGGTPRGAPTGDQHIDFDHGVVVTQPEEGQFRAFDANG